MATRKSPLDRIGPALIQEVNRIADRAVSILFGDGDPGPDEKRLPHAEYVAWWRDRWMEGTPDKAPEQWRMEYLDQVAPKGEDGARDEKGLRGFTALRTEAFPQGWTPPPPPPPPPPPQPSMGPPTLGGPMEPPGPPPGPEMIPPESPPGMPMPGGSPGPPEMIPPTPPPGMMPEGMPPEMIPPEPPPDGPPMLPQPPFPPGMGPLIGPPGVPIPMPPRMA